MARRYGAPGVPVTSIEVAQLWALGCATVDAHVAQTARIAKLAGHLRHLLCKLARRYEYQTLKRVACSSQVSTRSTRLPPHKLQPISHDKRRSGLVRDRKAEVARQPRGGAFIATEINLKCCTKARPIVATLLQPFMFQ